MNLQAKSLLDNTADLASKAGTGLIEAAQGIDLGQLVQGVKLPQLDELSTLMKSVLPQNLTQFDAEGVLQLLSPLDFQSKVKEGIESMQGLILEQINGVINEVTSAVETVQQTADQAVEVANQIGELLSGNQQGMFDSALEAVSKLSDATSDVPVISNFSQSISQATDTIKNLTPKQVRDLANPDYYNQVVTETLEKANTLLEQNIIETAQEYIQSPPSIASVGTLFASANSLLGNSGPSTSGEPYTIEATVATYYGKGEGADLEAYRKKTPTGKQLQSGKSCAVDNVNILYNSKVSVPGLGTFTAVDRLRGGSANLMLYYETKDQADAATKKIKGKMAVTVTPPGGGKAVQKAEPQSRGNEAKLI